MKVNHYKRIN